MNALDPNPSRLKASQRRLLFVLLCTLVVMGVSAWVLLATEGAYDIDDAPITYRYAENIAAGHGYVYNVGERIQGTSTPLFTLLLAALRVIGVPVPTASHYVNFISAIGVVVVVFLTAWRVGGSLIGGAAAAAYLLLTSTFLRFSMTGMETSFYALLIVAAFLALTYDAGKIAALLAALALVTRLDGAAVALGVFSFLLLARRRIPWVEAAIFAVVALPWYLFAAWYFGSPLPHSMLAKQRHRLERGMTRYWLFDSLTGRNPVNPSLPLAFIPVGIAAIAAERRFRLWLVAPIVWLAAYFLAYTLVGIDYYEWYLYPMLPVMALLIGCGVGAIAQMLIRTFSANPESGAGMRWVNGLLAMTFLLLVGNSLRSQLLSSHPWWMDYLQGLEGSRIAAGDWLREHAPADKSVYTGFIGHVGYQSDHYIYDGASLVTEDGPAQFSRADYTVLAGSSPGERDCGTVAEFSVAPSDFRYPTVIAYCGGEPLAQVGELALMNVRIAREVFAGEYRDLAHESLVTGEPLVLPVLELQWLVDAVPALAGDWQVFVHLTDADGNTLAQADHPLGRQVEGMILPPRLWDPTLRIYTYAEMPESFADVADRVVNLRLGVWNPATGEHLPLAPLEGATIDDAGRLVLPMPQVP